MNDAEPIALQASTTPLTVDQAEGVAPEVRPIQRLPMATPAGDILRGADAIAEFLFGDKQQRRKVYNLVDGERLPTFRLGVTICARRSVLLAWIAEQERGQADVEPPKTRR